LTAELVWNAIEVFFPMINDAISRLPENERNKLVSRFQKHIMEEVPKWVRSMVPDMSPTEYTDYFIQTMAESGMACTVQSFDAIKEMTENFEKEVKDRFTVKPRMTERDYEVVRLRDQEKRDWKEILKLIRSNPTWAKGRDGKLITMKALKAAYGRRKKSSKQ
jgi:hypothetical protein